MDDYKFFSIIQNYLNKVDENSLEKSLKVTITYTTGEKDVFDVNDVFWANMMLATKERKQYLYTNHTLINLHQVVKIQYEDLDEDTKLSVF